MTKQYVPTDVGNVGTNSFNTNQIPIRFINIITVITTLYYKAPKSNLQLSFSARKRRGTKPNLTPIRSF